jgi:hypothetical protein
MDRVARTSRSIAPGGLRMPSKNELIERIRQINRSADHEWLARFDDQKLFDYLEHLQLLMEPRGRHSRWQRRGDSPAVVASAE